MSKLLTLAATAALLAPSLAFAFNINDYEADTQVAHMYVSGQLDSRLVELGTNKQSGEFSTIWATTQKFGVVRYCSFYFKSLGQSATCSRTITAPDGTTF